MAECDHRGKPGAAPRDLENSSFFSRDFGNAPKMKKKRRSDENQDDAGNDVTRPIGQEAAGAEDSIGF